MNIINIPNTRSAVFHLPHLMFDVNVDVALAEDVDRRVERYRQREKKT